MYCYFHNSLIDILIGKDWNKLMMQLLKSKLIPLSHMHNSSIKQCATQFILQWIDFIDEKHSQVSIADVNTISVNQVSNLSVKYFSYIVDHSSNLFDHKCRLRIENILHLVANCHVENNKIRQLQEIECIIKDLSLKIDNQMIFKDNIYIFHQGYQLFHQLLKQFLQSYIYQIIMIHVIGQNYYNVFNVNELTHNRSLDVLIIKDGLKDCISLDLFRTYPTYYYQFSDYDASKIVNITNDTSNNWWNIFEHPKALNAFICDVIRCTNKKLFNLLKSIDAMPMSLIN